MSEGCVCVLPSARASSGTCRHGSLLPSRLPVVVGAECAGCWNTAQEYTQKRLALQCCCFGKVCLPQGAWLCGLVGWRGRALASPRPAPGGVLPTASCSPPSSSRPRSGKDAARCAVLWLLCRGVGPSCQCDPAAVSFTQTPPEDFCLSDWSHVLWLQSPSLIMETAEAALCQTCRQRCAQLRILQNAPGPM